MEKKKWCFPPPGRIDGRAMKGLSFDGNDRFVRPSRAAAGAWILAFAWLICVPVAEASHAPAFFAEPYTGAKVKKYAIELPVGQDSQRSFEIPDQCPEAMKALASGAIKWGNQIERRIWHKVGNDCTYHDFLNRFPRSVENDYITSFDFRNAPLAALLPNPCRVRSREAPCDPRVNGRAAILGLLEIVENPAELADFDGASCWITSGAFRGQIAGGASELMCRPDRRAPGFRVMSVNYADVNGDGYLDAVLRIIPLGPGASRMPVVLAYTRMSPDGDLSVPVEGTRSGGQERSQRSEPPQK